MSRANRDKGNRWKRDLAAYLRDVLNVDVRTSRDGRGGAQGGADFQWCDGDGRWWPGVRGVTIEAKDVTSLSVPAWLDQARRDAVGTGCDWWVVVHKFRGRPVGRARVYLPAGMLTDYLEHGDPLAGAVRGLSSADWVDMSLDAFVEVWW